MRSPRPSMRVHPGWPLSALLACLTTTACAAQPSSFTGTYTIAVAGAPMTLVIETLPTGAARGFLRASDSIRFELTGTFDVDDEGDATVEGTLTGPTGRGDFTLMQDDEGDYQLLLIPYDGAGRPRTDQATIYAVARVSEATTELGDGTDPTIASGEAVGMDEDVVDEQSLEITEELQDEALAEEQSFENVEELGDEELDSTTVELPEGTAETPSEAAAAPSNAQRDPRLVGDWVTQVIMNSPQGSIATELRMRLGADGVMRELGTRTMGSIDGTGVGADPTGGGEHALWRSEGDLIFVSYRGSQWTPFIRYQLSGNSLLLVYLHDGSRQLWNRAAP